MRNIKTIDAGSNKKQLVTIFKETLEICRVGNYINNLGAEVDILDKIDDARENTQLFESNFMESFENLPFLREEGSTLSIEITKESTVEAGLRLWNERGNNYQAIMALNFASALSVGGGVLAGAKAQEEDLCRCSALFDCIEQPYVEDYYLINRKSQEHTSGSGNSKVPFHAESKSGLYTDSMIYSGSVPFFRDQDLNLLEEPFTLSIITVPAPCVRDFNMGDDGLRKYVNSIFEIRMAKMLALAAYMGHRDLILGAWGCGAFGNDPYDVAMMFKRMLQIKDFSGLFDKVVFAVYAKDDEDINYKAFKDCFEGISDI